MTKEKLIERLGELQAQKDQAVANANAFTGAIQDCQYWLAQLTEAETAAEPKA